MKLLLLGNIESIHIQRWAESLAKEGIELFVVSMKSNISWNFSKKIKLFTLPIQGSIGYFLNASALSKIIRQIDPDLIHVHYASGYGTLIRLTRTNIPVILSVWGSDIFNYPRKSILHKKIIQKNLNFAKRITSTSQIMKTETEKYTKQTIDVIPFGIDILKFKPRLKKSSNTLTIGTVKTMHPTYGIDILIKAFAQLLQNKKTNKNLKLVIAGDGPFLEEYKNLAQSLRISGACQFLGQVPHHLLPQLLNRFDIFCAFSRHESFGVAVLEAAACGVPVIVSSAPGLKEVTANQKNGVVLNENTPQAASLALSRLINNPQKRKHMGTFGRAWVKSKYDWNKNVDLMLSLYDELIDRS